MPARLERNGDGHIAVHGELDFDSVAALWEESRPLFEAQPPREIDLGGVERSNSAGVALLVEWLRLARQREQELCFVNVPAQMMSIIRVAALEDLPSFTCREPSCNPTTSNN